MEPSIDEAGIREQQKHANKPAEYAVEVVLEVWVRGKYHEVEGKAVAQVANALNGYAIDAPIRGSKFLRRI